jgi:hypothetical protein
MTDQSSSPMDPERVHPQDPAEGADESTPGNEPREHPQEPAEGPDDESATEG